MGGFRDVVLDLVNVCVMWFIFYKINIIYNWEENSIVKFYRYYFLLFLLNCDF